MRKVAAACLCSLVFGTGGAGLGRALDAAPTPCPPQGDATKPKIQQLNENKARLDEPSDDDIDDTVTIDALVEPGDDRLRFQDGDAIEVTAYVIAVEDGGMASSNCHSPSPADHDTILRLVADSSALGPAQRVLAVVTPQWRRTMAGNRIDWSTQAIRAKYLQHWVKVTGWLLFNFEVAARALNTAELTGPAVTRATAWEIHPVTSLDLNEDTLDQQARSRATPAAPGLPGDTEEMKRFAAGRIDSRNDSVRPVAGRGAATVSERGGKP